MAGVDELTGYAALDDAAQVEVLRPVAVAAAAAFGLDAGGLELVAHAYNTTFAGADAAGRRVALRVGTNSASTPEHVVAQAQWQRAILAEGAATVAEPLRTRDGEWFARVPCPAFGRDLVVTAAGWLDGPVAEIDLPPATSRELGRVMARLHRQAAGWTLPPGAALPRIVEPLYGDPDRLGALEVPDPADRHVLDETARRCRAVFDGLHAGAPLRAVHADLHGGNLLLHGDGLAVLDFDDCGLGLPVLDLSVALFYLRGGDPEPERALLAGYREVAPLPDVAAADVETLVASRQLLMLNSLLATTTAELRAEAAPYLTTTLVRLRHWLDTGTFTRVVR